MSGRGQMRVIIQNRLRGGELVVKPAGRPGAQEKIIVNERGAHERQLGVSSARKRWNVPVRKNRRRGSGRATPRTPAFAPAPGGRSRRPGPTKGRSGWRVASSAPACHGVLFKATSKCRRFRAGRGASCSVGRHAGAKPDRATSRRAAAWCGPERRRNASAPACAPARCDRGTGRGPLRPNPAQTLWQCRKPSLMRSGTTNKTPLSRWPSRPGPAKTVP